MGTQGCAGSFPYWGEMHDKNGYNVNKGCATTFSVQSPGRATMFPKQAPDRDEICKNLYHASSGRAATSLERAWVELLLSLRKSSFDLLLTRGITRVEIIILRGNPGGTLYFPYATAGLDFPLHQRHLGRSR